MSTVFPHRRVTLTVEHEDIGDGYFTPMIHEALAELGQQDPAGTLFKYTAANGVTITLDPEPMDLPEEAPA